MITTKNKFNLLILKKSKFPIYCSSTLWLTNCPFWLFLFHSYLRIKNDKFSKSPWTYRIRCFVSYRFADYPKFKFAKWVERLHENYCIKLFLSHIISQMHAICNRTQLFLGHLVDPDFLTSKIWKFAFFVALFVLWSRHSLQGCLRYRALAGGVPVWTHKFIWV